MKRILRDIKYLLSRIFQFLLYRLIRAYSLTFRLTVENEAPWMDYLKSGGTVLLCTWHQQFFSAIRHFRRYRGYSPALMISRSRDGEVIAGIAQRTGWVPVRGSSSRGGKEALGEMIARVKETRLAGHITDGPRGPIGKVKPGLIRLAHATDAVIVPFFVSAQWAWHFRSWDRFMLPKPFSRVTLHFEDMIRLEPAVTEEHFEQQRLSIEQAMLPWLK